MQATGGGAAKASGGDGGREPVADSSVGEECVFGGTGVLVRACSIGARCKVGDNSRVLGSVLLRNVVIKEG